MADRISPAQRSANMGKVRSRDTKPELLVRRRLHKAGFRYRLHVKELPGTPDIVFPSHRTVVFVQGCFWHGHHCRRGRLPVSNSAFWREKIQTNRARDNRVMEAVESLGWKALVVWECDLEAGVAAVLDILRASASHVRARRHPQRIPLKGEPLSHRREQAR